jgi:hypothetical protein
LVILSLASGTIAVPPAEALPGVPVGAAARQKRRDSMSPPMLDVPTKSNGMSRKRPQSAHRGHCSQAWQNP